MGRINLLLKLLRVILIIRYLERMITDRLSRGNNKNWLLNRIIFDSNWKFFRWQIYISIDKIDKNGINRKNNNNKIRDLSGKGKVIVLWSFVQTVEDIDKIFMEEWLILEAKQISNSIHVKSLTVKAYLLNYKKFKFLDETRHFIQ